VRPPNHFDLAALRDAIGLARNLCASTGADDADPAKLLAVAEGGWRLRLAPARAAEGFAALIAAGGPPLAGPVAVDLGMAMPTSDP
jgi:hypothetical protein